MLHAGAGQFASRMRRGSSSGFLEGLCTGHDSEHEHIFNRLHVSPVHVRCVLSCGVSLQEGQPPPAHWGVSIPSPPHGKDGVNHVFALLADNDNTLLNVILPVAGLNQQAGAQAPFYKPGQADFRAQM